MNLLTSPERPDIRDTAPEETSSPALPSLIPGETGLAPAAPMNLPDTGLDPGVLFDLALKTAYTVPQFNTEWAARQLHLSQPLVGELLEHLRAGHLLDVLGEAGPFGYRYVISQRGRERASRLLEVSSYVGPAPVSLDAYTAFLEWQLARIQSVPAEQVATALADLVLARETTELAGLAVSSGRSLFLFGPPGNGKTSLARLLHNALPGEIWIPYCIGVDTSVIRVFDPQLHQTANAPDVHSWKFDRRWVRIRRPLIVAGGEMTLDTCDLIYSPILRYYELPLHVKANGGIFFIDDFGRQRVDPHVLLNRWIIPLEHRIDYLTLQTAQRIQLPFRPLLIVATNLDLATVTDGAFLRRIGYRLRMDKPAPAAYEEIFRRYARGCGLDVPPNLLDRLLDRYRAEQRELRCCDPRDLIERVRDVCRFRGRQPELNEEFLSLAWSGYFGV